ncbi:MAG: hypothetical protein NTW87_08390, partial [Planctomycetota bacterium]|nr:hypothetical protein [Planctomycetota bacterium]
GLFAAGTLAVSPAFQQNVTTRGLFQSDAVALVSAIAPMVCAALLWIVWRACRAGDEQTAPQSHGAGFPGAAELFLRAPAIRRHLAAAGALLIVAGLALSGSPLAAAPMRAGLLWLIILCLPPLLQLAAAPGGQRVLNGALAVVLGASALWGGARYLELRGKVSAVGMLLAQDKEAEAAKLHEETLALNAVLLARGPLHDLETHWALYRERKGEYESALTHWRRIAAERGVDPTEMLPIRRVLCEMGDSLNAWRRLIYQGFPAITDPELAPGIKALADRPESDLRARLLAALLSWEQREPREEIIRRLEAVRKLQENEPSACALLERLGVAVPQTEFWLPGDLIVGRKLSAQSGLGAIEDLGEVDTVVVLSEGHWEMGVNARGTPLHEEWPVIGVELNGQMIARTQVNRAEDHEVPFTFAVNRGNIYHVRIVLENRMEDMLQGRVARRGLTINGLMFRRAADK